MLTTDDVKMDTIFHENLFVKVHINNNETLLVGIIYRSDSGTEENNENSRKLLDESCKRKFTQYMLMGDFNYPGIDWGKYTAGSSESVEHKFLECIQDNFMFQFVSEPTRWRGMDTPNLLDLIISKDESNIDNIEFSSPLGKSHHCVITFDYICNMNIKGVVKERRSYRKADYTSMREEVFDWDEYLTNGDIDIMWKDFCKKSAELEELKRRRKPLIKIGEKNNKNRYH